MILHLASIHFPAKIDAANELDISVIMVERPVLPVVEKASTVLDVLRWAQRLQSM